jgi:RNA recognition motif-containing protein
MVPVYPNPPGPSYPQYPNGQFPAAPGIGSSSQSLYNAAPPAYSNHSRGTPAQTSHRPTAGLPSHGSRDPTSAPATTVSTSRKVFLSGIPPNGAWQNLKDLLQRFGHVERCDVPRDKHHPDKAKGTATAEFSSNDEALKAIKQLNGFKWEGSVIRAKFDQVNTSRASGRATASSFQSVERSEGPAGRGVTSARLQAQRRRPSDGPLVVNGSRGTVIPSKSRRGSKEDDGDASDVDSSDDEGGRNVHRGETE